MAHDLDWASKQQKRERIKYHIRRFLLFPEFWTDPKNQLEGSVTWNSIKFTQANVQQIPRTSGIYCFIAIPPLNQFVETKYLFYVGKASSTTLHLRYKQYLNEKNGIGIGSQKPRIKGVTGSRNRNLKISE